MGPLFSTTCLRPSLGAQWVELHSLLKHAFYVATLTFFPFLVLPYQVLEVRGKNFGYFQYDCRGKPQRSTGGMMLDSTFSICQSVTSGALPSLHFLGSSACASRSKRDADCECSGLQFGSTLDPVAQNQDEQMLNLPWSRKMCILQCFSMIF